MYNTPYDFNILFLARQVSDKFFESDKVLALENETGFRFAREEAEKYILFVFEPNINTPYRSIDIREFIKEHTNANNIERNPRELEEITSSLIKRSRGIIQERISRSSEVQTGSGSICEGSEEVQTGRRSIRGINGDEIWGRDFDARVSFQILQQRNQRLEETNHLIQQSEPYKQQALKAYEQSGITFTSSLNNQESQNNQSKLFSNFKNKLNDIHQNLENKTINTNSFKDTLEIDKTKSQNNQESQDSFLKTQRPIKRNRK